MPVRTAGDSAGALDDVLGVISIFSIVPAFRIGVGLGIDDLEPVAASVERQLCRTHQPIVLHPRRRPARRATEGNAESVIFDAQV
jgi:hypothetical protein